MAALATGLALVGFDVGRGVDLHVPYHALVLALTLVLAVGVGGAARLLRRSATFALALWAGLHVGLLYGLAPGAITALGAGLAGARWASASPRRGSLGLAAAIALAAGLLVVNPVLVRLGFALAPGREAPVAVAVTLATYVGALVWLGTQQRRGRVAAAVLAMGLLGIALLPRVSARTPREPPVLPAARAEAPDVLLLILDTVRADHLSLYGYDRDTTPELERFRDRHPGTVVYSWAFSNATWTLASHASLFTGRLPSQHGVTHRDRYGASVARRSRLRAEDTLAERLASRGYRTAFVFANILLEKTIGFDRGFDWYRHPLGVPRPRMPGESLRRRLLPGVLRREGRSLVEARQVNRDVLAFLDRCEPGPCFIAANYMEAHAPYVPRSPHAGRYAPPAVREGAFPRLDDDPETLQTLEALYDEEIRSLDAQLGELFDALEARGWLDGAWVVVTADHGEAFAEHDAVEHGTTVYNEVTRIPLLIKPPRGAALAAPRGPVDLIDVAATLAAVGDAGPLGEGRDLRAEAGRQPLRAVQIEMFERRLGAGATSTARSGMPARAVVIGHDKLEQWGDELELYDLEEDPFEQHDLAPVRPERRRSLATSLPPLDTGVTEASAPPLDLSLEERDHLRELGYLR